MIDKDYTTEMINLFRQFKLGDALFKSNHIILNDEYEAIDDIDDIVQNELSIELSKYILKHHISALKKTNTDRGIKFDIELMVLKPVDFKTLVEAVIQLIPQSKIDEIKNGKFL